VNSTSYPPSRRFLPEMKQLPAQVSLTDETASPLQGKHPCAHAANAEAMIIAREDDLRLAAEIPETKRLRLVPSTDEIPVLTVTADKWLTLGRSVADADFIAQFRPRSSVNDARSRRISRAHARAQPRAGKIRFEERNVLNPSVYRDARLQMETDFEAPLLFLFAGEYPLELHRVASDYNAPRESNQPSWKDAAPPEGSLVVRSGGPGVLLWETALVLSDVGIHFSQSGRPWFRVDRGGEPSARVHRFGNQFWIEQVEHETIKNTGTGHVPKTRELLLLRDGLKVTIGGHAYMVQPFTLSSIAA
jgi:hypothetical protein